MASLALHDKAAADAKFLAFLPLVEIGAQDERNFVRKGVSWALRGIGRRNRALNAAALVVARRLAQFGRPPRRAGSARTRRANWRAPRWRPRLARKRALA